MRSRLAARSARVVHVTAADSASSRLLQELRAQHQALDLVGAAFDFVGVVGEVNASDHGAALEHSGRTLQLQILDQRNAVASASSALLDGFLLRISRRQQPG